MKERIGDLGVIDILLMTISDGKCSVQVERVVLDKQEIGSAAAVQPTSVLEIVKSMWLQTKPLFQRPNLSLTIVACLMQFAIYARYIVLCHFSLAATSGHVEVTCHGMTSAPTPVIKPERTYLCVFVFCTTVSTV